MRASLLVISAALALVGCGSVASATPAPEPVATPAPTSAPTPAFDIAPVRASFTEECVSPIIVDDAFCIQVDIAGLGADGETLTVPTTLNPRSNDRGAAICDMLAIAHFSGEGADLGYKQIGVLDMNGGQLAGCDTR